MQKFDEFCLAVEKEDLVLVYSTHEKCSVCKVLRPKLKELVSERLPQVKWMDIDTELQPEIAGQNQVFTVPVVQFLCMDAKPFVKPAALVCMRSWIKWKK
jgi:thioredoxin-like negative regulator of GroEL